MESFKEIKDYYNGNFENLKDQIFRDLKIINQKSSYDDNFKLIENPFYWELMVNEKIINDEVYNYLENKLNRLKEEDKMKIIDKTNYGDKVLELDNPLDFL